MKNKIYLIIVVAFFFGNAQLKAQQFILGFQSTAQPAQILIDQYTMVALSIEKPPAEHMNHFDFQNPYTYIQMLSDKNNISYQILYQTDFFGKVLFLAYSNNLTAIINKQDKPMLGFLTCIKNINRSFFPTDNIDIAINCLINRLNYCSE